MAKATGQRGQNEPSGHGLLSAPVELSLIANDVEVREREREREIEKERARESQRERERGGRQLPETERRAQQYMYIYIFIIAGHCRAFRLSRYVSLRST